MTDAAPAAVRFPVGGMVCIACVNRITRSLRRVQGVRRVRVDLLAEQVTVWRDRDVNDEALRAAVVSAGYEPDLAAAVAFQEPFMRRRWFAHRRKAAMDRTGLMHAPQLSAARQLWNFVRHFLEMCIAMCVVGTPVVLLLTRVLPSSLGWPVPADTAPEVTVLIVAAVYTLPMVAWMRFRGMDWRPVLEMGGATFAVGVGLVALAWLGLLSRTGLGDFASPAFCTPACAVMFLAMLPRLDMYTGRSGHQMGNGGRMAHAM